MKLNTVWMKSSRIFIDLRLLWSDIYPLRWSQTELNIDHKVNHLLKQKRGKSKLALVSKLSNGFTKPEAKEIRADRDGRGFGSEGVVGAIN